ncbi:hypothetical protein HOLleu_05412 [Holothuria leucospilota]|uniref:Uncharacterized protein n=1 Tax=Holothuria leucospilota TaxID=206669 RepID=A0A9Q1CJT4_HOLLE|nr:hypothetical protein HOLleu_05412 [Holothuria leucospilota]
MFTVLDAGQASRQVKLTESSRHYVKFNTPYGRYQFCISPFGLCSAPARYFKNGSIKFLRVSQVLR